MFNPHGTYRRGPVKGEIGLLCKGAIGLRSILDMVGLYPIEEELPFKRLIGLTFMYTARGRNPADHPIGSVLKASNFKLTIPGGTIPYYAEMSDWKMYIIYDPGRYLKRPVSLTLSSEQGDDVCFAKLNKYLLDPGFPFWQYGRLIETNTPTSAKQIYSIYRLGVNVPVVEAAVPGWAEDIPSEAELFAMMKPALWAGPYTFSIDLSAFTVAEGYEDKNYSAMRVDMGLAIYDTGELSYVGSKYVGDKTKPWPDHLWSGTVLTMLSGVAVGKKYVVSDNFKTGSSPPYSLPPNERLLKVYMPGPTPESDGAKKGDTYKVQSHFNKSSKIVLSDKIEFGPGTHGAQTLNYWFELE